MDRDVRPRRALFAAATRAAFRAALRAAFAAAVVSCAAFGYGLSGRDRVALESFTASVDRWQVNPEFRALAAEYSIRGSAVLRTRTVLVPADRLIIAARSCPLLPERYGLNPTCRLHYEDFSRGPLSAYLHLCDEQAVHHVVAMLEELGRRYREERQTLPGAGGRVPSDADLADFLGAFKLDSPVVKDAGAVQSVAALVVDTEGIARPFRYRAVVGDALAPHVRDLAGELGFPADVRRMTVEQQRAVLDRLDAYVRRRDPELWRTKQVSDFCAGIWAHVFGRSYNLILKPFLGVNAACRVAVWALLLWAAFAWLRGRQAPGAAPHAFAIKQTGRGMRGPPHPEGNPPGHSAGERGARGVNGGGTSAHAPAPARPGRSRRRPA